MGEKKRENEKKVKELTAIYIIQRTKAYFLARKEKWKNLRLNEIWYRGEAPPAKWIK